MNPDALKQYKKFRAAGMGGIVGQDAMNCLDSARTLVAFWELEREDQVRLRMESEQEDYFSVFGKPDSAAEYKRTCDTLERLGCYYVVAEYRDEAGFWQHADSIGMCVYNNPLSPYENTYVVELMSAAVNCVESVSVVI